MFQNFYHKPELNSNANQNDYISKLCYCGKERNLDIIELQCERCSRWFHQSCLQIILPKMVKFLTCYSFLCKNCHPKGDEAFEKKTTTKCKFFVELQLNI